MRDKPNETKSNESKGWCLSRRDFLLTTGATAAVLSLGGLFQRKALAEDQAVLLKTYPRKKVGTVSGLRQDEPVFVQYPHDDDYSSAVLIKLGKEAGGGVGPRGDIVAFSTLCTHAGGNLAKSYKPKYKVLGACPLHLTTFDLTRHGIVAAGQATESLPQIVLEVDGDEIYATGVMGLLFGTANNLMKYPVKQ
ncbi:MAG TPA: arsenate reductase (azurin) small subunit [Symbiobacteriaceae bacterium]|jgi:arsenite oxidase small subunit